MLYPLIVGLGLIGCVEDVGKDKVHAEVGDAKKEAPKPAAAGETWNIDPAKSTLKALGAKITATHPIDFKEWSGSVTVEKQAVTAVRFSIDMAKLESDHPKLTEHLLNEDFFDVANHPTATFESTGITSGAEKGMTHTVVGNLTIRGTTKEVKFPANIKVADGMAKANTEFAINRQDFKVSYPGRADDAIQDNVVLTIDFTAKK